MILAVDLGNSNVTFGCMNENTGMTIFEERVHTDFLYTSVEYAISLKSIFNIHGIDPEDMSGSIISSSAPPVTRQVRNAIEMLTKKPVIEVGPGIKTGVDIKIDNPGELGPDLLTGAVAAISEYGSPVTIVDMGTATTVSVINKDGKFIGGIIMPGVRVSLKGLTLHASHLPDIAIECPKSLISGTTVGAMQSGSVIGHASSIDGIVDRIWENLGYQTNVVATGGFARTVIPCCKNEFIIDSQLIMKGLLVLYKKNKSI